MAVPSAITTRRKRAVESFKTAADCIGDLQHGDSLFAITRGQFSMIDAIMHVLQQTGPATVSIWPRTVAVQKADLVSQIMLHKNTAMGIMVMQTGDEGKNAGLVLAWQDRFGGDSIKHVSTHAKIATIEGGGFRILMRGSMNLGAGARFEQFDMTEGGADFDLVRSFERRLPSVAALSQGVLI